VAYVCYAKRDRDFISIRVYVSVCMWVCVCELDKKRTKERERARKRDVQLSHLLMHTFILANTTRLHVRVEVLNVSCSLFFCFSFFLFSTQLCFWDASATHRPLNHQWVKEKWKGIKNTQTQRERERERERQRKKKERKREKKKRERERKKRERERERQQTNWGKYFARKSLSYQKVY